MTQSSPKISHFSRSEPNRKKMQTFSPTNSPTTNSQQNRINFPLNLRATTSAQALTKQKERKKKQKDLRNQTREN
jgi:CelD/BcsL family acetyltransferase involved in cellulose biosynthesis